MAGSLGSSVTAEERQEILLKAMRERGYLTVDDAWNVGHNHGFYQGGEGMLAKDDLNALAQRNQARRTDGFWRHSNEPDRIRLKHKHWADYWTPAGKR